VRFSVIIPVYNEVDTLPASLRSLLEQIDTPSDVEILVSDAGSDDGTRQQLQRFPVRLIDAPRGRASQMNHAARQARGDYLLFLHADTRLPADWPTLIDQSDCQWGFFRVRLSSDHPMLKLVAAMMNWRSCASAVATGDQAMFFQRGFFEQLKGFPQTPLMEDIAISKLARRQIRPACIARRVVTSSRRWEQNGIFRTIVLMWWLRLAYWAGVTPQTLHRWYYGRG
jgi:rSAM/selenodomain-associated transferase 2